MPNAPLTPNTGKPEGSVGFAVQPTGTPALPNYRASDWDISGSPILTKPCGCTVNLIGQFALDFHETKCIFRGASDESLRAQVERMIEHTDDDGIRFSKRYRRRRHAKEAKVAYLALLELSDRMDREMGIGPYNPDALEIMNALAAEERKELKIGEPCQGCGAELAASAEHGTYCPGCLDGREHMREAMMNDTSMPHIPAMPVMHKQPERSYSITLEDAKYGARSREEMLMEISAAGHVKTPQQVLDGIATAYSLIEEDGA